MKLMRILKFLKGIKHMKLTITINDLSMVCWWVDASDQTHMDSKGHIGSMISLGGGTRVSSSKNTKSTLKAP